MKKSRSAVAAFVPVALVSAVSVLTTWGCSAQTQAQVGAETPPPPSASAPPPASTTPPPPPPVDPPPPPPVDEKPLKAPAKGKVEGTQVSIPGNVVYETGKAKLKPESEVVLSQLKQFLDDNPQVTLLRIEGHTDSDGDDAANLKLSGQRSVSVVKWLVDKGIDRGRLLAVGFGEMKPIADNNTKEGKEQNRRTEFHIAALEGKSYKNRAPDGGGTIFK